MYKQNKIKIYMTKASGEYHKKTATLPIEDYHDWHHITISQIQESSANGGGDYKLSIRVNGKLLLGPETNNLISANHNNLKVYASSPKITNSMADAPQIDAFKLYNLRLIKNRIIYKVKFGSSTYHVRVGPSTLTEAKNFCASRSPSMMLYKPHASETIHKLIHEGVAGYGITTYWTQANYDADQLEAGLLKQLMSWMDGSTITPTSVPDWFWNQWKESVETYRTNGYGTVKNPRIGGCGIVGLNNRGRKVTSVKCNEDVADVICQPIV